MPTPSALLVDSIAGSRPAQKELGFFLDSLMPLMGGAASNLATGSGGGIIYGAAFLSGGNGLTGSGYAFGPNITFNVGAGNGIAADPDSVRVLLAANSGLGFTGGALAVGAGTGIIVSGGTVSVDGTAFVTSSRTLTAGAGLTGGGTLAADRTFDVGAGSGITVNANDVAVNQSFGFAWTGAQTWSNTATFNGVASFTANIGSHLTPNLTDTYDLGSSLKLWRKGWLSELDAILFAQNTITLLGGWFMVTPDEGLLPVNSGTGATVNFGKAMTLNAFVLFRAALMVEYMKVGTLVSGTTYNVTRDLDGSGTNNWVAGSVFAVLGTSGQGRIELNSYDTPRISILRQGATYNAQTEMVRIGDMNGAYGTVTELYGFGAGDYSGGNYLAYNTSAGFVLKAGSGTITLSGSGLAITVNNSVGPSGTHSVEFYSGASLIGTLWAGLSSPDTGFGLQSDLTGQGLNSEIDLYSVADAGKTATVFMGTGVGAVSSSILIRSGAASTISLATGVASISGGLNVGAGSGAHTGEIVANNLVLGGATTVNVAGTIWSFQAVLAGTANTRLLYMTGGAHTGLTSEALDVVFGLNRTVQYATASVPASSRAFVIQAPTYSSVGAATLADAATFVIDRAPQAGPNLTITRSMALWVQAGWTRLVGGLNVGSSVTDPGAGNIQMTGTLSVGGNQVVTGRRTGYTNAWVTTAAERAAARDAATITLVQLAQRVRALQDDLTTHGLIGP